MFQARNIHYDVAKRTVATSAGGIGVMHQLAQSVGLIDGIDNHLHLLKVHLPYHESDHVLNFAYNILAGGQTIEDMELRRQDEGYLQALGTQRTPDPTTAGDFCRRFDQGHIQTLQDVFNQARLRVWRQQKPAFFEQAIIDVDGTLAPTTGECKAGMDYSYKGVWGYHPLLVSLANTREPLLLSNRPGNRPSHEGAAHDIDKAIDLCQQAGFKTILLRGDTDFTQCKHLDRWDAHPRNPRNSLKTTFIFGFDAIPKLKGLANDLEQWESLNRPAKYEVKTQPRAKKPRVKEAIVRQRQFKNLRLVSEEVAEFDYQPGACDKAYRVVVVRKNISVERGEEMLFDDIRYFFYITNDRESHAHQIVRLANGRCDQENLIEQLKNGVKALRMPTGDLLSNWAYMVMASLAWSLKAWLALLLPEDGRWGEKYRQQKYKLLRMEFRQFLNSMMRTPAQVVWTGRRVVLRLLSWNVWQAVLLRAADTLRLRGRIVMQC